MLCLCSVGAWNGIECIFREEGYNLCTIEIQPLYFFFFFNPDFGSIGFNMYVNRLKISSDPDTLWSHAF